ncbi:MAG TPA: MarR family winged helix-turn-helix transcriptional regulator [Alphaproteobacteria bacterium]
MNKAKLSIDLDRHLPHRLVNLANRLEQHAYKVYSRRFGLTFGEWRVLGVVAGNADITVNRAAELLGLDKGGVSRTIAQLLRRKLLTRRRDPTDRRRSVLALTTRGARIHDEIAPFAIARDRRLLSVLSPAQRRDVHAIVEALTREIERMLKED